ncbi:hypothetical protein T08_1992, partial [Trichinella sp. T8]
MYSVLSAGLLHSQNPMFRYIFLADFMLFIGKKIIGSTEIRTRIAGFKVPPRFELGLLDSKSRVLAVTPWNRQSLLFSVTLRRDLKILKYCNLLHCRKL